MKHIKNYNSYNESNDNSIIQVINTISNLSTTLGLKFEYITDVSISICELNLDLTAIKNSILSIIINAMFGADYRLFPISVGHDYKFLAYKGFNVKINSKNNDSESLLNKKIEGKTGEEIYKNILKKTIEFFETIKDEFWLYHTKFQIYTSKEFDLPFIKELIINYLKLLISKPYKKNMNFNFKDLYKLTYNTICQSPDNIKVFTNIYKNNSNLYNHLKEFGEIKLDTAINMGDMGF